MDKLYFLLIDEILDEIAFNRLFMVVSKERQKQISNFYFNIDKKLSLYAEVLIRISACKILGIKNEKIKFCKGKYGKPYIKDHSEFQYNISHTKSAVAVAISNNPVGVDIEKIRKIEYQIVNRFFSLDEQKYVNEIPGEADRRFYEIWTQKEAYIKYIGKGLSMPLDSFNVLDEKIGRHIQHFERKDYIISVCKNNPYEKYDTIIELNEQQLELDLALIL